MILFLSCQSVIADKILILQPEIAQMAELVDASDSKSGVRKDVQVRFLFWAQKQRAIFQ